MIKHRISLKVLGLATVSTAALSSVGRADTAVAPQLAKLVSVSLENDDNPRPTDVGPVVALRLTDGSQWKSADWLGRQPIYLVSEVKDSDVVWDHALAHALSVARTAHNAQVEITCVPPWKPDYLSTPGLSFQKQAQVVMALDPPSFIVIDRAGFVRDVEPLPDPATDPGQTRLRFLLETTPDPTPLLKIGLPAPDFSFRDAEGQWRRIADLRGRKNLLLTFFPKCFTGGCAAHLSSLRDNYAGFIASNTEIWAVSVDPRVGDAGQQAFAAKLDLPFPLLPDTGRNISLLYGAVSSVTDRDHRESILIDKDGVVRWIDRDVAPATHGTEVLMEIHGLGLDK